MLQNARYVQETINPSTVSKVPTKCEEISNGEDYDRFRRPIDKFEGNW